MDEGTHFLQHRLSNGIRVVGEPMAGVESAAVGLLFGAGARTEEAPGTGITHFIEQMVFRGTERRDARQISETFDSLGATYDSSAGIEMTLVSSQFIGSRLADVVDLLVDCARSPVFPEDAVESVRTLQLQEIRQREDRPAQLALDMVRREFFSGSPLGNDVLGTPETISEIDRDALIAYHTREFTAGNLLVSVAGNFDWDMLIETLERTAGDWGAGPLQAPIEAPTTRRTIKVQNKESSQENIGFAFPGIPVADEQYFAAAAAAQALGGGTNSRLHREVREKRGLAYSVQARFDGLQTTGLYRVYVGTSAERAPESIAVVLEELGTLQHGGITADELRRAKIRLKSQSVMRSESSYARMAANMRSLWLENRLYTLDQLKERIDRVTVDDVARLTAKLAITENIAAVALGPRTRDDLFRAAPVVS